MPLQVLLILPPRRGAEGCFLGSEVLSSSLSSSSSSSSPCRPEPPASRLCRSGSLLRHLLLAPCWQGNRSAGLWGTGKGCGHPALPQARPRCTAGPSRNPPETLRGCSRHGAGRCCTQGPSRASTGNCPQLPLDSAQELPSGASHNSENSHPRPLAYEFALAACL